jgi:hypothetical protein
MKYTFILILLSLCWHTTIAQGSFDDSLIGKREWKVAPLFLENNQIVYKEEVMLNASDTKDLLFSKALAWYNYNYSGKGASLTENDKVSGRLSGKGIIQYNSSYDNSQQTLYFSFEIVADYGKYSYKIYNITGAPGNIDYSAMYLEDTQPTTTQRWTHKYRYEMISDMETYIKLMISLLKESMKK